MGSRSSVELKSPAGWRWGRLIDAADLRHDANIFTILRWILASSVIFSHAFEMVRGTAGALDDPSLLILPFHISGLAVLLFFSLSGFLVTGSLAKRGLRDFVVARALRLIPGLWVMLIVTSIVLGLAFNAIPFAEWIRSTSLHAYLGLNMLLQGHAYTLDGIFPGNPMDTVVNGSLWTIPQEVRCYLALALIGAVGLLASRRILLVAFIALIVVDQVVPRDAVSFLTALRPLSISFFFGVLLYLWRDRLFLSWPLAIIAVAGGLAVPAGQLSTVVAGLAFSYATMVAAVLVPPAVKRLSAATPDYSYGIYIYAFPAQQVVFALGIGVTPYANMVFGFLLTLPLAALSWHLVEKPALALKPRWSRPATIVK